MWLGQLLNASLDLRTDREDIVCSIVVDHGRASLEAVAEVGYWSVKGTPLS